MCSFSALGLSKEIFSLRCFLVIYRLIIAYFWRLIRVLLVSDFIQSIPLGWEQILLFFILALVAEILGTISGFGSSVLFVPMAGMFFDFSTVLGVTALFHVFSNVFKIYLFRQNIDRKLLLWLGLPSVIFVIIGAYLSQYIQSNIFKLILAIVLIGLSIFMLLFRNKRLRISEKNYFLGGLSSGFLAGFIGTGGAIRGLVLSAMQLEKDVFIASSAWIDLGIDLARTGVYFFNGYIQREVLWVFPGLILMSLLGSYLGKRILKHISEERFSNMVLLIVAAIGLYQLWSFFFEIG